MRAVYLIGDVFERLAELPDASIDFVMTSPPFIGLRSYLPDDHPRKAHEIGSEPTPEEFIDVLLRLCAELRRVLAPHGSIAVELGDTYSGSGGAGGDYYNEEGWRAEQPKPAGSSRLSTRSAPRFREGEPRFDRPGSGQVRSRSSNEVARLPTRTTTKIRDREWTDEPRTEPTTVPVTGGEGWPLAKSKACIPELFRIALTYGLHPLTGKPSPAGQWIVRNCVTWVRSNPPVGALGDKFRTATSDIVIACTSEDRWWDEVTIRRPASPNTNPRLARGVSVAQPTGKTAALEQGGNWSSLPVTPGVSATAPPLDWWNISAAGYQGAHHAVYPPDLCIIPIQAMAPREVCRTCGEPRRPIVETTNNVGEATGRAAWRAGADGRGRSTGYLDVNADDIPTNADKVIRGWTHCGCHVDEGCRASSYRWERVPLLDDNGDPILGTSGRPRTRKVLVVDDPGHCAHDHHRRGIVLDPFGGSGTTGLVATGQGRDAILIDLDERNADLAVDRIGALFLEVVPAGTPFTLGT